MYTKEIALQYYTNNDWSLADFNAPAPEPGQTIWGRPSTIAAKIAANERVIDVGCGKNWLKNKVENPSNIVGIDFLGEFADVSAAIEEYTPTELFDVAVCLGVMHLGDEEAIQLRVQKIVDCLKPTGSRIYWGKIIPGPLPEYSQPLFYPNWTQEKLAELATQHGFTSMNATTDTLFSRFNGMPVNRLYVEWHR